MGSSLDDSLSSRLSSTLDIEFLNNLFLYYVVGFVLYHFHKSLLLMYMYTNSFAWSNVHQFYTLLWTNEYEL
jgi:hypothetical protein